jgi:hypothetical protein
LLYHLLHVAQHAIENGRLSGRNFNSIRRGGVEERLARKFGNSWNGQDGFWNRQNDDTVDPEMEEENRRATPAGALMKHALAVKWAAITSALVDHHQFGSSIVNNN